jgi:hypothetical protein
MEERQEEAEASAERSWDLEGDGSQVATVEQDHPV